MNKVSSFFDEVKRELGVDSDAVLAQEIGIEPANLSRLRHRRRPISDSMVLRIHEITGWDIRLIKGALDMPCHTQVVLD